MRLWELMEMKPRKLLTGELRIPEKVEVIPAGYVRQKLQNKTVTPGPARQVVMSDYYISGTIAEIDEENVAADREIPWGVTLEKGLDYNIVAVLNQDRDVRLAERACSDHRDPDGYLSRSGRGLPRGQPGRLRAESL